jgi:hypothetical protein
VLLSVVLAAGITAGGFAQTPTPSVSKAAPAKQRSFASPGQAADALTAAIRKDDDRAVAAILGNGWREFVPGTRQDEDGQRAKFMAAWDEAHKVELEGEDKAVIEVGKTRFVMPIPLVKESDG